MKCEDQKDYCRETSVMAHLALWSRLIKPKDSGLADECDFMLQASDQVRPLRVEPS